MTPPVLHSISKKNRGLLPKHRNSERQAEGAVNDTGHFHSPFELQRPAPSGTAPAASPAIPHMLFGGAAAFTVIAYYKKMKASPRASVPAYNPPILTGQTPVCLRQKRLRTGFRSFGSPVKPEGERGASPLSGEEIKRRCAATGCQGLFVLSEAAARKRKRRLCFPPGFSFEDQTVSSPNRTNAYRSV